MPWKPGAEVWHYRTVNELYEPMLFGHVLYVGAKGFTMKRLVPDMYGDRELRIEFGCPGIWATEAEARAWCAEHVGPWGHLRHD